MPHDLTSLDHLDQEELWDARAAATYDTPGTGMEAPDVLGPTVDRLAELAGDGRALELAVGTGRVAIPLVQRGIAVTGIEISRPDGPSGRDGAGVPPRRLAGCALHLGVGLPRLGLPQGCP
ncbi:hypothetical protein [uncultured Arsenicicoccus sp.]|uniref:hypothetical protein n=1 Tax=uncultured Arsenicicoccus sp. TaxID=491339 RepID=UPI00338D7806